MKCNLCNRNCNVDRNNGIYGYCKMPNELCVAKLMMHKWEEPFISGIEYGAKGTGAIFFYGCNLSCVYCQNYRISNEYKKNPKLNNYTIYTEDELSDEMIKFQNDGAYTISLITANIYIEKLVNTIILAKKKGLNIPVVYNTSGYDKVESLKMLKGLIDIYMPDFKYFKDDLSIKYSDCSDYVEVTKEAIKEMYEQVGKFNEKKGVLVRHLVLPNHIEDSKKIIKYLHDLYSDDIYISIMNQYTPTKYVKGIKELEKPLKKRSYDKVIDYALSLGINNAFIQDEGTDKDSFIPDFL